MRAGASIAILLWFGASVYAGYRLTERSFAWIHDPNFGVAEEAIFSVPATEALGDQASPDLLDQVKRLSPQQLRCLQAAIPTARFAAVLRGEASAQEITVIQACLK